MPEAFQNPGSRVAKVFEPLFFQNGGYFLASIRQQPRDIFYYRNNMLRRNQPGAFKLPRRIPMTRAP